MGAVAGRDRGAGAEGPSGQNEQGRTCAHHRRRRRTGPFAGRARAGRIARSAARRNQAGLRPRPVYRGRARQPLWRRLTLGTAPIGGLRAELALPAGLNRRGCGCPTEFCPGPFPEAAQKRRVLLYCTMSRGAASRSSAAPPAEIRTAAGAISRPG